MGDLGTFAFGQPVLPVVQEDRTPKQLFVLGVYSSAVHARWVGPDAKIRIQALAVASEPCVFWRGEGAEEVVARIDVPRELGRLEAAHARYNGPSGRALDARYLRPLGLKRDDAWLCDLVPHSCKNPRQAAAVEQHYDCLIEKHGLSPVTMPSVPVTLAGGSRRAEILEELRASRADVLMLLGDQPIRWFLRHVAAGGQTLAAFGRDDAAYGRLHDVEVGGRPVRVLPLAHPRQAARLGTSSTLWGQLHDAWVLHRAPGLLGG